VTGKGDLLRKVEKSVGGSRLVVRAASAVGLGGVVRKVRSHANTVDANVEHSNLHLLLSFVLTPDSNCIDIGAAYGVFLSDMVRLSPRGKHLAFEPITELYESLVSKYPSADIRQIALANESGEAEFNWLPDLDGYSGLVQNKYAATPKGRLIKVRTERLDEQLPVGYAPSLIKIDVEGGEYAALKGGIGTLSRYKPLLIVEYPRRGIPIAGMERDDLYEMLVGGVGYRAFDLVGNGPLSSQQFLESPALNFVFHV
jgi:FkbM family methyltransferase